MPILSRFSRNGGDFFQSHVGAGALTRPGGDFFRAAEGNLPSHTCHSEERRDESLLSYTCHSESASAVRNLLFAGVPILFAFFAKGWGLFCRSHRTAEWDEKNYPSPPIKLGCPTLRGFRRVGPGPKAQLFNRAIREFRCKVESTRNRSLFPPRSAMTSTEGNESHAPSRRAARWRTSTTIFTSS